MFLAAAQYSPLARHAASHKRRPRLSARSPRLADVGDDAAIRRETPGSSDAAEPSRHHALRPNPQVSRSRQGQALMRPEMR